MSVNEKLFGFGIAQKKVLMDYIAQVVKDVAGGSVSWSSITGKPSTYTPTIGTTATTAAPGTLSATVTALAARVQALEDAAG